MSRINATLINFKEGGRQPHGRFDMRPCVEVVAADAQFCDLVVVCEGNRYAFDGGMGKHALANALAAATGRPLAAELGSLPRGEFGPVVLYDPGVVRIETFFGYGLPRHAEDKRNWMQARHAGSGHVFGLLPIHFHHLPAFRMTQAQEVSFIGDLRFPVFLLGDTNVAADGGKTTMPNGRPRQATDYSKVPASKRYHDGRWQPGQRPKDVSDDTAPLDFLLGWWDNETQSRVNGREIVDLAEVAAYRYGEHDALTPTVLPRVEGATAARKDLVMANRAGADCLVPGTFRVEPFRHPPTVMDHAAIRFSLDLQKGHFPT
ncbi:hypothetical protein [Amycolatopsis sp. NPDC006125]|uniref:hypothetical protein n=1 Tax=Amycolatopsis sp. NPDC006125 TaxID=3156730 RepID=UPI0033B225D5